MGAVRRPNLDEMGLSLGKKARLHRLLYGHGLKNGTLMILPIDQGLEHGPLNFFPNPPSADPDFQWRLALEGNYNAIALHYGLARKYMDKYAGAVGLVFGRNMWQRPFDQALAMTKRVRSEILANYGD